MSVPANAEVDHDGRFADKGEGAATDGLAEKWVRLYRGVSDGERRKRWWDIVVCDRD